MNWKYLKHADERFCINTIEEAIKRKDKNTGIAYTLRLLQLQITGECYNKTDECYNYCYE